MIEDPIYLAEPQIMTKSFQLSAAPISPIGPPCVSGFEGRPPGESVPHFLPEKNPFVDELTKLFHIPREAVLGAGNAVSGVPGRKSRARYVRPEPCKSNCGAVPLGSAITVPPHGPRRRGDTEKPNSLRSVPRWFVGTKKAANESE